MEFLSSESELLHLGSVCVSVGQKNVKKCQNMSKSVKTCHIRQVGLSICQSVCLSVKKMSKSVKACQKVSKHVKKVSKPVKTRQKSFKTCQNKSKKDVLFSMTVLLSKLRNSEGGCQHMAQFQLYSELIIDFSRSCFI